MYMYIILCVDHQWIEDYMETAFDIAVTCHWICEWVEVIYKKENLHGDLHGLPESSRERDLCEETIVGFSI